MIVSVLTFDDDENGRDFTPQSDILPLNSIKLSSVNFINVLCASFVQADPISIKRYWRLNWIFTLSGSARIKAACRTLMKLTPDVVNGYSVEHFFFLPRLNLFSLTFVTSSGTLINNYTEMTWSFCFFHLDNLQTSWVISKSPKPRQESKDGTT